MTGLALLLGEGALAQAAYVAAQQEFGTDGVAAFALCQSTWPDLPLFDLDRLHDAIVRVKQVEPQRICVAGRVDLSQARRDRMIASLEAIEPTLARDTSDLGLEILFGVIAQEIGAQPIGVHEFTAGLLAGRGHLFGPEIPIAPEMQENMLATARKFGETDLGQSLVFAGARPIAGEDIGGTDALLRRVKVLSEQQPSSDELCLVKVKKPQQSGVGDLPTIGRRTVEMAAAAHISVILIEAGTTLVLDQSDLDVLCHQHGVRIIGAL